MKNQSNFDFFEEVKIEKDGKYSYKIKAPIYKPRPYKPHILELFESGKTDFLIEKIKTSSVSEEEKKFLIEAAKRHTVFNFNKIADYYAHAGKEMQELMEDSALVIIDFDKAIENGFVKLAEDIAELYLEDRSDE